MRPTVETNNSNVMPRKTRSMIDVSYASTRLPSSRGEPRYEGYDIRARFRSDSRTTDRPSNQEPRERNGDEERKRRLRAEDLVIETGHNDSDGASQPHDGKDRKKVAIGRGFATSKVHVPNFTPATSGRSKKMGAGCKERVRARPTSGDSSVLWRQMVSRPRATTVPPSRLKPAGSDP
jgi:hypothetical protein